MSRLQVNSGGTMTKAIRCEWVCVLFLCAMAAAAPQTAQKPLRGTRLLALVAGNVLPENVVALVKARGLAFKPTEHYLEQLGQAGATSAVLNVVGNAKVQAETEVEEPMREPQILAHLATAGKLIREEKFKEAETEANAALEVGGRLDAAFVMGEALRQEDEWMKAAAVFAQIIKEEHDFPETQTQTSVVLYETG